MMDALPQKALSVRQPWAWAIIHGGKDVENRSWQAVNYGLKVRGRIAIHASAGMTQGEYRNTVEFMCEIGVDSPCAKDLHRGGIIGSVEVIDVVTDYDSPWFEGPRGLILRDPRPCEFIPTKGALGYFNWRDRVCEDVTKPAAWMTKNTAMDALFV